MNRALQCYTDRYRIAISLIACAICLSTSSAIAAEVEIRVEAGADEIFIGESVDYHIEIRHAQNPSAPDLSEFKQDFDVVSRGDESRNQSSTFIVNGRVSQQNVFSHVYHYRLTPKGKGTLTIPPAKATIDGKSISSRPLTLRVIDAQKQDLVQVEIKTSRNRVYPTQPFTVSLRVYVQPLPNSETIDPLAPLRRQPPHLQLNWVDPPAGLKADEQSEWLQSLLSQSGVGFTLNELTTRSASFFDGPQLAVFGLSKGRETRDTLDGTPVRYFAYELSRTFTPEKTGLYEFGPAIVKGTFVSDVEGDEYHAKRLVAIAPSVSVEVRDIPTPRPATYCGGIGNYSIAASASPTALRVGDPLTLNLEFARSETSGSLDLISAPDLTTIPEFAARFDLIDRNPTGRVEGTIKKFTYALRPRQPNVSIPPLSVMLFDPDTEKFNEVTTTEIPLEVAEASKVSSTELIGSMPASGGSEIKSKAEGIYQNILDPTELRDERVSIGNWIAGVISAWCLAGLAMGGISYYRHKSTDVSWQRRQQARRMAQRRISLAREAMAAGQAKDALRHVRTAMIGLIADLTNRVTEGLTASDVGIVLTAAKVPSADQQAMISLIESLEAAEYGVAQPTNALATIETAANLITQITPHLERGVK